MSFQPSSAIIGPMTAAPVLHVIPTPLGNWNVQRAPDTDPLSRHGSATEAEREARRTGAREIHVHDRYGRVHRVRAEST
jgi:hypothetical protein